MSKNMTRKGLAIGLGAALVASTFGFAPANAAGQDDKTFISLLPRTGTEYTVLLDQYFDLKSNVVDSLAGTAGKDLKFLVSDPQSKVFIDQSQVATDPSSTAVSAVAYTGNTTSTLVTSAAAAANYANGDKLYVYGFTTAAAIGNGLGITAINGKVFTSGGGAKTAANTTTNFGAADIADAAITKTGGKVELVAGLNTRAVILDNAAIDADLLESATITSQPGKVTTAGRASDGTFVINTETNANTSDRLLRLVTNATTTYSVDVTAWVDSNDNGLIDPTEYTSPTRTVKFVKPGDVTAVTTLAPVVGSTTMSALITTTPVLNGQVVIAQDKNFLSAKFTRSLSAVSVYPQAKRGANTDQTVTWDDVTKTWTATVSLDADAADESDKPAGGQVADSWSDIAAPISGGNNIATMAVSTAGVVTVTTNNPHKMVSGDKVTFALADDTVADDAPLVVADVTGATVTVTGASSFTYPIASTKTAPTTAIAAVTVDNANDDYAVATYAGATGLVDRVGAETYTATAVIQTAADETLVASWTAISAAAETGVTSAATASGEVSTAASTAIQGKTYDDNAGNNPSKILTGTKSVPVTFTALDADGDALGAGRPVVVTLSAETGDAFSVNGHTSTATVLTDANGQATVTVTSAFGYASSSVKVTGVIENAATVHIDLEWADASFGLVDLSTTGASVSTTETRTIQALGSYSMNLAVLDQWYNAPAAGVYRLKVTGEGAPAQYVTLTDGKANLTVTDTGVYGTQVITVVDLEKLSGTTVVATTTHTITADVVKTFKVVLGADGTTTYGTAADLSDKVAAKALLELDKRVEAGSTPAYANDVLVNGRVMNAATSAGKQGAVVTISGPSNVLFDNGEVAARGSLTFLSGASGNFEVKLYSTTAQTDTVITVTSNGASSTVKVSFTGTGVGEGTLLALNTPAAVKPASTFKVSASLKDAYGNPVDTAASRIKVTHTGPGIVYGTLPTETDAFGELSFSVLLGSNDSGNITFQVQYDQNGDGDFKDAKDLSVTQTVEINATGTASSDAKVNAGSFKGYVAIYAKGYEGKRLSAKVGKDWVVVASLASNFERVVEYTGAGYTINVPIYIDRVLVDTITVTTK